MIRTSTTISGAEEAGNWLPDESLREVVEAGRGAPRPVARRAGRHALLTSMRLGPKRATPRRNNFNGTSKAAVRKREPTRSDHASTRAAMMYQQA